MLAQWGTSAAAGAQVSIGQLFPWEWASRVASGQYTAHVCFSVIYLLPDTCVQGVEQDLDERPNRWSCLACARIQSGLVWLVLGYNWVCHVARQAL